LEKWKKNEEREIKNEQNEEGKREEGTSIGRGKGD